MRNGPFGWLAVADERSTAVVAVRRGAGREADRDGAASLLAADVRRRAAQGVASADLTRLRVDRAGAAVGGARIATVVDPRDGAAVLADPGADALDSVIAALATARALGDIAAGHGGGDRIEGRVFFEV